MINEFKKYLKGKGLSDNTIKSYVYNINGYMKWFKKLYFKEVTKLYRQNVLEYKLILEEKGLDAKTINHTFSSLRKFNEFLVINKIQDDIVISDADMINIQEEYLSPTKVTDEEVRVFLQNVLESDNIRNYALVILIRYTGLRISEALKIKLTDFNLLTRECVIRGKGNKQRIIYFNKRVTIVIKEYLKVRDNYKYADSSPYLFVSNKGVSLNRTRVNKIFNKYSNTVTPHQLRHYFATKASENKDLTTHELAYLLGHSNIHTTMLYTHPDKNKIKEKLERLGD